MDRRESNKKRREPSERAPLLEQKTEEKERGEERKSKSLMARIKDYVTNDWSPNLAADPKKLGYKKL